MKNKNLFARGKKAALLALTLSACTACWSDNNEDYAYSDWTSGDDIVMGVLFAGAALTAAGYGTVEVIKSIKNKRKDRER